VAEISNLSEAMPGRRDNGWSRNLLFFLAPRIMDFDTYLPIAMEMAAARPQWRIRFVVFDAHNYSSILANSTMMAGLERCGSLHFLGSGDSRGVVRLWRRLGGFAAITGWILRHDRPVLFSSRAFSRGPYLLFSALAWLRGGNSYLLWKNRSPDEVHHIMFQTRNPPPPKPTAFLARLLGRDQDAVIHYHDQQKETLGQASAFGRIFDVPWLRIGLPHHFSAWRQFIDDQIAVERARLEQEGVSRSAEIYTVFAAKSGSSDNLGLPGAVERSFKAIITALTRLRPDAVILIRAHPKAVEEPYIMEGIAAAVSARIYMSAVHPEVLLALSRRCLANNPTNILFAGFPGQCIDCSEYPDSHFKEHGEVSLAHGYGPLYINPLAKDFDAQLSRALEDDSLFEAPELTEKRDCLHRNNPPCFKALLNLLEGDVPFRETSPAAQKG
jgi:hypothetical protein